MSEPFMLAPPPEVGRLYFPEDAPPLPVPDQIGRNFTPKAVYLALDRQSLAFKWAQVLGPIVGDQWDTVAGTKITTLGTHGPLWLLRLVDRMREELNSE